jgi:beta-lactamase regulating signal transducer with metallopeptidase domain
MRLSVYAALALALLLGGSLGPVARRFRPAGAVATLVSGALLAAGVWTWCLVLLASTLVGQLPLVASIGRWSEASLAASDPVHPLVALAAWTVLLWTGINVVVGARRLMRQARPVICAAHLRQATSDGLVVVHDARPAAMAVPGWPGRVIMTSAMLRLLSPAERRVVLAHEHAHLRHGHAAYRLVARLAACLLPTLRPVVGEVDFQLERWADEVAGRIVGSRRTVAETLARVALAGNPPAAPASSAFHGVRTSIRVAALVEPLLPVRRRLLLPVLGLAALILPLTLEASHDLERLFELSRHVLGA